MMRTKADLDPAERMRVDRIIERYSDCCEMLLSDVFNVLVSLCDNNVITQEQQTSIEFAIALQWCIDDGFDGAEADYLEARERSIWEDPYADDRRKDF